MKRQYLASAGAAFVLAVALAVWLVTRPAYSHGGLIGEVWTVRNTGPAYLTNVRFGITDDSFVDGTGKLQKGKTYLMRVTSEVSIFQSRRVIVSAKELPDWDHPHYSQSDDPYGDGSP